MFVNVEIGFKSSNDKIQNMKERQLSFCQQLNLNDKRSQ